MFDWLFEHDFVSRGQAFQWRADLIWMHGAADVALALAYFSIPIALSIFVRRAPVRRLRRLWWILSAFALLSGVTFALDLITIWIPFYRLYGVIKLVTALACLVAVPIMLRLTQLALSLRTPVELEHANEQLLAEAEMRRATEQELRQAHEAALQASHAKSGFLANMSHEIRTPMNAVMGMTAALIKTPLSPPQQEIAETIRASSESLLALINDILDLSKIESGAESTEAVELRLDEVIERAVLTVAERAQTKGLELVTVIEPNVPSNLRGDARRLHQVLVNLSSNAVKFTEQGEVEVRAALESQSDANAVVRFTVRDTGIGILREARERLFQPFMQADSSTTRKYGGTGLGLAISKRLVEIMGGTIQVESHTGRGSTFWFALPFAKDPATAPAQTADAGLAGMRALIVEDNDTSRRALAEHMVTWGMQVDQVRDSVAALDKVAAIALGGEPPYHFAVIDRSLPGTGGLQLAERLRLVPALAAMHIVLLHNMVGRDAAAALQGAGVAAALPKPVRHSLLRSTLTALTARAATLPAPIAAAGGAVPHKPSKDKEAAPVTRWRILVAEDNALNQQVLRLQLKELGQQADFTGDGLEALQALQKQTYDVVLMDCQMPGLDGYDATAEIRRRERGTRHTWIIATTAHAMVGDRERCLAAGMDDYISKPVSTEALQAALERFGKRVPAIIERRATTAAAPGKASATAVEFTRLRDIARGNTALLHQLANVYVTQTSEQLAMLRTALAERSARDVERIAHRCAGSSGTVGMDAIATMFSKLEQIGRSGQLDQAEQLTASIESAFVRVRASVKALPSTTESAGVRP